MQPLQGQNIAKACLRNAMSTVINIIPNFYKNAQITATIKRHVGNTGDKEQFALIYSALYLVRVSLGIEIVFYERS